jgi:putative nucleotidyltransferase with HDIG domain
MFRRTHAQPDQYLSPAQICVGMYVHLDLSWSEHPFALSSFKIKNEEQLTTLRSLGLKQVRCSPQRGDAPPGPRHSKPAGEAAAPAASTAPPPDTPRKRPAADRLAAHRIKVAECERTLMQNARMSRSIGQNLPTQADAARRDALRLIDTMASSMLLDADVTIHLMSDRIGGEAVYQHALNVSLLSMMLAREMHLGADMLHAVGLGALFHDAGRGAADSPHRDQPDRQHLQAGLALCRPLQLPAAAMTALEQHHEQADGSGYPSQLTAAQISPQAKVVALVDAFDELCNPENPAVALTPHEALSLLYGAQRHRYDNHTLMTFVRCLGIYPPGTIVTLSNGAIATVVAVNGSRPLKPLVQVHDVAVPKKHAQLIELEQQPGVSIVGTLRPQELTPAMRQHVAPSRHLTYQVSTEPALV